MFRLVVGVCLVYAGFAFAVRAELGLGPFNVVQQGIARHWDISLGHAGWLTGSTFVVLALVLSRRPGPGTLASVFGGGFVLDAALANLQLPASDIARVAGLLAALFLMSFGGALYLSAALGASPLDGVMLATFHRLRGRVPLFAVRTVMELSGLALGWGLGGKVGVGSVVIGLGIGPGIHASLHVLGGTAIQPSSAGPP